MKLALTKLSTKNLATFTRRVIEASEQGTHKLDKTNPLLDSLKAKFNDYDAVYAKLVFSGKGKEVKQADSDRDKAYSVLRDLLKAYAQATVLPNHSKAEQLHKTVLSFGSNLAALSYSEESAQLEKLLAELEKTAAQELLTELGLTPLFTDLKAKQTAFEKLFAEQAEANADLRMMKSASALRKDLETSLKLYLDFVTITSQMGENTGLYADLSELAKSARNSE